MRRTSSALRENALPLASLALLTSGAMLWLALRRRNADSAASREQKRSKRKAAAVSVASNPASRVERLARPAARARASGEHPDAASASSRIAEARANSDWSFQSVCLEAEALRIDGHAKPSFWSDPKFPPSDASLFKDPANPPADWLRDGERGGVIHDASVAWKGPESFCPAKRPLGKRKDGTPTWLYSDEDKDGVASCTDMNGCEVCQGSLGDCYLICALATAVGDLSLADDLIDEEFEDVGIYGVSLWVQGRWEMVWVDRNFPCYRPSRSSHSGRWRPIFASCEDPKEIWPLVVEKAYAKLHGSYEQLSGGRIVNALCALTGGQGIGLALQSPRCNADIVWTLLSEGKFGQGGARFLGAGSRSDLDTAHARGIVTSHAYSVLDARQVEEGVRLVKLRNPWNRGEWEGEYCDGSPVWHTDAGRRAARCVGYTAKDDGEFWMPLDDFVSLFCTLEYCDVTTDGREVRLAGLRKALEASAADRPAANGEMSDIRSIDDLLEDIQGPSKKGKNKENKVSKDKEKENKVNKGRGKKVRK